MSLPPPPSPPPAAKSSTFRSNRAKKNLPVKLDFTSCCLNFGQNDITLIHSTYTENGIKNAASQYASAACLPRSRNDANSHSVMPQLCVLSVRLSGNERYYL